MHYVDAPKKVDKDLENLLNAAIPGFKIEVSEIRRLPKNVFEFYLSYEGDLNIKALVRGLSTMLSPITVRVIATKRFNDVSI